MPEESIRRHKLKLFHVIVAVLVVKQAMGVLIPGDCLDFDELLGHSWDSWHCLALHL